ncbi:aldo-keto reductase [Crucibulum laeve]|uniref:Aldo-keto reductase n=1 Tax=Crucibulum laeve TaxID=68775 RepID=A0A5C3LLA5_9AGAR|nr:aldo-keto reductase [Crucibulum laeve]
MENLTLNSTAKLRDGNEIPILGFGTYEMEGREAYQAVTWALEAGYRHIDSAAWYENEKEVGQAILDFCKTADVPRSDIFFTTKLKLNNGYANVRKAIQKSLDECGLGYIDLYLIHGPLGGSKARKESWEAICDVYKEGTLKSIGISTFGVKHLKEIVNLGLEVPAVHQIDLHPFMTRREIVGFSQEHGMMLEAWAPLVRGCRFDHPSVVQLAKTHNKEPAQVLLRYSLQKGYIPLPKSVSKKRIISNTKIFDFSLTEEELTELDGLDEGLVTDWDPTNCE